MDVLTKPGDDHDGLAKRRLTVAEFHRMGEAGILGADERVELIEGQLVAMSPIGPRHALAVDVLMERLMAAVGALAKVRVQNPITLDHGSEPTPDIVVARAPWRGYPTHHPGPEDVLLVVEVGESTIAGDLGAKRRLYARAGIREYWVVDLTRDVVRVHRTPTDGRYASASTHAPDATLDIEALPDVSIPARPIFT